MNRRHFLGMALSAATAPVFAAKQNHTPRILSLRNLHTKEQIEITYRIGDCYQRDALRKLVRTRGSAQRVQPSGVRNRPDGSASNGNDLIIAAVNHFEAFGYQVRPMKKKAALDNRFSTPTQATKLPAE